MKGALFLVGCLSLLTFSCGAPFGKEASTITPGAASTSTGTGAQPGVTQLSVSNTANLSDVAGGNPTTFAAQSIGAADSTRIVVVSLFTRGFDVASVSIGGTLATKAFGHIGIGGTAYYGNIYYLAVPAGTTADIVVTTAGGAGTPIAGSVYSLTGSSTTSYYASADGSTANGADHMNTTFDIPAYGASFWVGAIGNTGFVGTYSTATTNYVSTPGGARTVFLGYATSATALTAHNEELQNANGGSSHIMVGASFAK